jgi:PAS domain S-box-containing protein
MEEGQEAMEPIRELANRIIAEEGKLLEDRQASRDAKVKQIERLALVVSVCALASFGILYALFLRANKWRHRAETDLQKSNAELEQRVQDRTAELSHTVEKLERADEFRSKVMESAIFGVGALDLEGKFTLVNAQFESLMGYAPNELLGKPYSILLSPQNDAELRPMFRQVLCDKRPLLHREIEVIKKDGSVAPVVFGWSAVLAQGEVRGVVGTVLDITDLKKMEHALRESEHRVRMIIDTALDGVIIIDSAGYVTGWNPQAEKMFGWSEREIVGKRLSESIIPERFREAHEWGLKNYAMTRTGPVLNRRIEMIALNRNGEEFSVELAITPMQFGNSTSFSAFVRNITERKRVEARVQAQLFRLDLLRTTTRAIGERLDLASIFQVVVKSLEQHLPIDFGCVCLYEPQEETLRVASVGEKSQSIASRLGLVNQASVQIDDNGLARCIHGELVYEPDVGLVPASFPRRLAEGGLRSLIIAPLIVESRVFGVLIASRRKAEAFTSGDCEFLRQLSEHVALAAHHSQLHAALQNAFDELRQTQQSVMQQERLRAIGQMASGIAHDINNGLSPVAVYTELLLETEAALSDRARDYLTTIRRGVDDVAQTVSRMRDFSRNRETQLALTDIDLNEAVQQVLDLTRVRWKDLPHGARFGHRCAN